MLDINPSWLNEPIFSQENFEELENDSAVSGV